MIILNDQQFEVTRRQRGLLAQALAELLAGDVPAREGDTPDSPLLLSLQVASLEGLIGDLDRELNAYERDTRQQAGAGG